MGTRTIKYDDLTGREIEGKATLGTITLILGEGDNAMELKASWDLSENTADSLAGLIESDDLAGFIVRMRPMVSLTNADSPVIRAWAKDNHPELKVPDHGRLGAEVVALYRREVVQRVSAGDTPANSAGK